MEERLGTYIVNDNLPICGVGFVVVPSDLDRNEYIEDCYRTKTLTINGGFGFGFFRKVPCPLNVLENIDFPLENERGTAVIWLKEEVTGNIVIANWLQGEEEYYQSGIGKKRILKKVDDKIIEILFNAEDSELFINLLGDSDNPSNLKIKVNSKNKDSVFDLTSDNKVSISAAKDLTLKSFNALKAVVLKENGGILGEMKYIKGTGFQYTDEFENKIIAKKDEVQIIAKKKINLGNGKEPMVLGDTLVNTLSSLIDAISAITVTTPNGPSSTPVNIAQFTVIKNQLKNILSGISNTE